ncbi:MAG: hypothetical protein CVV27_21025 [Candidatus Melainabacteria bacterium HGW-Melainabacteria-1]|nr:MAG: hypothetical protein CVV27_21025 [Candidatus Melainabacteria bacterium HGW-Melainabacteria-1]
MAAKTVKCETCGREVPKSSTMQLDNGFICKNDDGLCVKPGLADKAKALVKKAQAEKDEKAQAKAAKAAPKPKQTISYRLLPYTPAKGEKAPPRQVAVILATLERLGGTATKQALLDELQANNGQSQAIAETFTHDLQARQPVLAIVMHYQRKLIDEGRWELIKS